MTPHLTHEQLCDLLLSNRTTDAWILSSDKLEAAQEHVRECHLCAAEFAQLQDSLSMFRATAHAWANQEWQNKPMIQSSRRPSSPVRALAELFARPAAVWAVAAAAVVAIALPLTLHQLDGSNNDEKAVVAVTVPHSAATQTQSDEALLEEISQTVSYSVPAPMRPLANPTDGQTSSTQRKN